MHSLYWKICAIFLGVVIASAAAGVTTFQYVWWKLRTSWHSESWPGRPGPEDRPRFLLTPGGRPEEGRREDRILSQVLGAWSRAMVREVASTLEREPGAGSLQGLLETAVRDQPAIFAAYITPKLEVTQSTSPLASELMRRWTGPNREPPDRLTIDVTGTFAFTPIPGDRGYLMLGVQAPKREMDESDEVSLHLLEAALAGLGAVLMVAVVLGLLVFRVGATRLDELGQCIRAVAEGDLTRRVPDPGNDEIGALGRSLNVMAERLERLVGELASVDEKRRQFLADVSHELRTPVTSIRVNLQRLLGNSSPGATAPASVQREGLTLSLEEIEHLTCLVEDLLELGRMESPHFKLHTEECVLQRIVSNCLNRLHFSIENRRIQVVTNYSPDPVRRLVDERRFGQAILNLLTNAIRSLDQNGTLEVIVEERGEKALIEIKDNGPGIPPETLPHLFQRYRTTSRSGTGLGLSIVKRLVESHGGSVRIEPRPGGGTIATLEL